MSILRLNKGLHAVFFILVAIGAGLSAGAAWAQATERTVFISTYPNGAPGFVSSMLVNPDGTLMLVGTIATSDTGCQAVSLSRDGEYLAVSHGTAKDVENVDIFKINADSTLTFLLTKGVPDSPLDLLWISDREIAISETQFGGNAVGVYRLDPVALTLTEIDREFAGAFHSDLALDPLSRALYANDSSGFAIRVFDYDLDGELTLTETHSTDGIYPLGIEVSQYGDFLYAGGGISADRNKVLGYEFTGVDDALTPIAGAPFISPGSSPKQALPMLGDRVLFVGHGTDATVRSFLMNGDGFLTSTGHSFDVGFQGSLGKISALGDLLFVPDNTTAIDGKSGVYVFRIGADGSMTMIGSDLFDTGLSSPNSIATYDPARGMFLEADLLEAGRSSVFNVAGGKPGSQTALLYSTKGMGLTFIKIINAAIDLRNPKQAGKIKTTDSSGRVTWRIVVPDGVSGLEVWFQAVQYERVSNAIAKTVE